MAWISADIYSTVSIYIYDLYDCRLWEVLIVKYQLFYTVVSHFILNPRCYFSTVTTTFAMLVLMLFMGG
jgi:hypothetical protein